MSILSRIGDFITAAPEQENVTVIVNFYSLPQADLSKSVMAKFNQAKADALKLDGLLSTLQKIFDWSSKLCSLRGTILNALAAIDGVTGAVGLFKMGGYVAQTGLETTAGTACKPVVLARLPILTPPGAWGLMTAALKPCDALPAAVKTAQDARTAAAKAATAQRMGVGTAISAANMAKSLATSKTPSAPAPAAPAAAPSPVPAANGPAGDVLKQGSKIPDASNAGDKVQDTVNKPAAQQIDKAQSAADKALSTAKTACDTGLTTALKVAGDSADALPPQDPDKALWGTAAASLTATKVACSAAWEAADQAAQTNAQAEKFRNQICGQGEGLKKKFTDSIDKYLAPFCNFINCDWGAAGQNGDSGSEGGIMSGVGKFFNYINPNNYLKIGGISPGIPVKDSMVWSVASLCLPGIISNINKYREINCKYALCIGQDVVGRGLPISSCEKAKEYALCQFIWGQVFNSIPFVGTLQGWVDTLESIITNPFAAFAFLLGQYCKGFCDKDITTEAAQKWKICAPAKTLDALSSFITDIKGKIDPSFWSIPQTACDQLKSFKPPKVSKNATTTTSTSTASNPGHTPGSTVLGG